MSHETEIIADEWVAARDEIRRLRTVNAALLEALEDFVGALGGDCTVGRECAASLHLVSEFAAACAAIALAKGETHEAFLDRIREAEKKTDEWLAKVKP